MNPTKVQANETTEYGKPWFHYALCPRSTGAKRQQDSFDKATAREAEDEK